MSTEEVEKSDSPSPKDESASMEVVVDAVAGTKEDTMEKSAVPTIKNGSAGTTIDEEKTENARTDQNDVYSMKVKPEYVVAERHSSLPPLPPPPPEEGQQDDAAANGDDRSRNNKKKMKGVNRKRPRDEKQDASEKICLAVIRGTKCQYGAEDCKFSHDVKAYMATRPPDIVEVGTCPIFAVYGKCMYGAMCRFGSSHINMSTGENIETCVVVDDTTTTPKSDAAPLPHISINVLPKEVQTQLRKRSYPFRCKRFFETKDNNNNTKGQANLVSPTSTTTTPVELLKTRKIIDFSNKIYVAPLTTVGNLPFRRIMKKYGADITCGEMALATCLLEGKPSEWALLKRHPEEDVFGVQIAAAHADQYTRVAELIEDLVTVDFVDMNLGCPLDLVCNKGAGAKLMLRENKLKEALVGMSHVLSCPITVKMRTGWDMTKPFAHKLVPKIQSWGIDGIGAIMVRILVWLGAVFFSCCCCRQFF
jgi:tRNA-dihydrouridine synthase 3